MHSLLLTELKLELSNSSARTFGIVAFFILVCTFCKEQHFFKTIFMQNFIF